MMKEIVYKLKKVADKCTMLDHFIDNPYDVSIYTRPPDIEASPDLIIPANSKAWFAIKKALEEDKKDLLQNYEALKKEL